MGATRTVLLVVVAVCIAQVCGKQPRGAGTEPVANDQLQDVVTRARDTLRNVSSEVTNLLGLDNLPDRQEVVDVLKSQTEVLSAKIQDVIAQIGNGTATRSADVSNILDAISARLGEAVTNLKTTAPGVTEHASDLQSKMTDGFRTFVEEAGKLAKAIGGEASVVQEDLDKLARTAIEQVVDIGQQVEQRVKSAVEGNQTPEA